MRFQKQTKSSRNLPQSKTLSPHKFMQHFDCNKIQYEGPDSKNAISIKHYNATEEVGGKAMKDHLRFGAAYWHVMRNELAAPFGAGTAQMPWDDKSDSVENALGRVDVFFEFLDQYFL